MAVDRLLDQAWAALPKLLRSLKGITAKRANQILGLIGKAPEHYLWSSAAKEQAGQGVGCGPGGPPHSISSQMLAQM